MLREERGTAGLAKRLRGEMCRLLDMTFPKCVFNYYIVQI